MNYFANKKMLILCLSILLQISCKEKDESSLLAGPINPNPDAPTPGVVDSTGGFNIKVNPPIGTNYYIHKSDSFDNKCVIAATATTFAERAIDCIVEVEELEGMFHGIDMVLNVPPSLCTYVRYHPYYFFGLPYGVGPTAVEKTFVNGAFVSGIVTGPGQISGTGNVRCDFDYSSINSGPNCCLGTYTLTTRNDGVDTVETGVEWGGKPGNCVAGAGANDVNTARDKSTNMPLRTIFFKPDGYSESFKTGESSLLKGVGSVYFANYYSGAAPTAFTLSGPFRGNPHYEWACLDDAYELKYRIRVAIREWNEMGQFVLKAAGDPDTNGFEPDWSETINDHEDWGDYLTSYPGMPQ